MIDRIEKAGSEHNSDFVLVELGVLWVSIRIFCF